jgi:glutathione S-transferase
MPIDTDMLSLANPVFHTSVLAASIMLLKLMLQPWMTVGRMMSVRTVQQSSS